MKNKMTRKPPKSQTPKAWTDFEKRKLGHLHHALDPKMQAVVADSPGFLAYQRTHDPMAGLNFEDVSLSGARFGEKNVRTPFYVSGMTAGVKKATLINARIAEACENQGWIFALGSLRRECESGRDTHGITALRKTFPGLVMLGNLGAAQLIDLSPKRVLDALSSYGLDGLCIHLNPLQEVLQPEGTPHFKGLADNLSELCRLAKMPVILKETGCGFAPPALQALRSVKGLYAIDLAGLGGTHWGRIEGARAQEGSHELLHQASETFRNWGVPLEESLAHAQQVFGKSRNGPEIWASGGVRDGLYAQYLRHLGAHRVGFAKPVLEAAQVSTAKIEKFMERVAFEARVALFCRGGKL